MFYESSGTKYDAKLHDPILLEGDEVAAFRSTYKWLVGQGWREKEIAELYGDLYRRLKG